MIRQALVTLLRGSFVFLLAVAMGCSAQNTAPADLNKRIEQHVRVGMRVPPHIGVAVGERKASPDFQGLDVVPVTFSQGEDKQTIEFLISKDNKTLYSTRKFDLTRDLEAEARNEAAKTAMRIDTAGRPFMGNPNAKVVLVNYDDFQCPFCARMHNTLINDIMKQYGDRVKLVYKDFPLEPMHGWARRASVNANCLASQNNDAYWAYATWVHNNAGTVNQARNEPNGPKGALDKAAYDHGKQFSVDAAKLQACVGKQEDGAVAASVKEASELGVEATPTLFINGHKIDGAVPREQIAALIEEALKHAK